MLMGECVGERGDGRGADEVSFVMVCVSFCRLEEGLDGCLVDRSG